MAQTKPARVRFAPSPTGRFHIGSARTALYNHLLARQTGGSFILRIEDTDQKRFVEGSEDEIRQAMDWMGLQIDEGPEIGGQFGPYRQSERLDIYAKYARELVDNGHAYYCFCQPERLKQVRELQRKRKEPARYDGLCRRLNPSEAQARVEAGEEHVIRFKTPKEGQTTGVDIMRGEITVDNNQIDDYILVKSNGIPVYHLAAMVDDHLMEITHVFRGMEWLPTFPLHIMIYEAFGWEQPQWAHLSVFLKPSGKGKMSKRDEDVMGIFTLDFAGMGYLPEAVNNWLALMGWAYDDHTEIFTMESLIEKFSLEKLNPSAAAVNFSKLDHFNGVHIRMLEVDDLTRRLLPFFQEAGYPATQEKLARITPIIQERIVTLKDAVEIAGFFFEETVEPQAETLIGKKMTAEQSAATARAAYKTIADTSSMDHDDLEMALRQTADDLGLKAGQLFGILRMAVTGQKVSPPLIESMAIIGKHEVLKRIEQAAESLEAMG
ncbi:MAG: glutamate--tRNA ligase [Anaerolineales bacterium]|jgi:glutamyl-tRNA synthetase